MKWLKEGDANSKFFHKCVQKRRKVNEILGLHFDGNFVEGVHPLKEGIRKHFEDHFRGGERIQPLLGNLNFPMLNDAERNLLVASFLEKEIKEVVWNCDNNKSLGPDEVSFSFIK